MNPLNVLTISSVSIWLGAQLFFSAFVAPAAFSILEREAAVRLVNAVFPRYFLAGLVLGLVALAGVVGQLAGGPRSRALWGVLALLVLMLALTAYTLAALLPAMETARHAIRAGGADPARALPEAQAFARLHRLSVILNGLTLLAGLAVLALEAAGARRAG